MFAEKAAAVHQAKPIRSALRQRPPKPSSRDLVTQWKSQFAIVRELVDNMSPLYTVARDTSSSNNVHVVLVPPDDQLQSSCFVPQATASSSSGPTASSAQRHVSQATVRAHVFRGCSLSELTSLAGCTASIVMGGSAPSVEEHPPTETPCNAVLSSCSTSDIACMGTAVVEDLRGNNFEAKILSVGSSGNPFFSFFFIDRPVYEPDSIRNASRRSVAASVRFSSNQPLWQKFPCSAVRLLPLPATIAAATTPPAASVDADNNTAAAVTRSPTNQSPIDRLGEFLHLYRADELYFRTVLTELANEKDLLADAGPRLSKDMDRALLIADTEANCFAASYVCVDGFESFMVSKVLQIVETSVEIALHEEDDDFSPNGASGHGASSNAGSEYSSWSDEEREQLAVAFHTIISGSLGLKVVHHWESRFEKEDIALNHACISLRQRATIADMLPNLPGLRAELFDPVAEMLTLLDEDTLSVFSYLRIFETTMNYVIDKIVGFYNRSVGSAKGIEITADECIPLIVYTLMLASPLHLFSRLNYILDLSIPPLELSSLGYSLTTFEAAASQLLEEYRLRLEAV